MDEEVNNRMLEDENCPTVYNILHQKRKPPILISNVQTFFILFQGVVGIGFFQGIDVFSNNWSSGVLYTVLGGLICTHCLHILFRSETRLCRILGAPHLNYAQSLERAVETGPPIFRKFSERAHFLVDAFFILCQFALCCSYCSHAMGLTSLITTGLEKLLETNINYMFQLYFLLIPLILLMIMKDLRIIVYFSTLGVILVLGVIGFIFWDSFRGSLDFNELTLTSLRTPELPIVLGPVIFSLESVTVMTHIEQNMKTPKSLTAPFGVLNFGMVYIVFLQSVMGYIFYARMQNLKFLTQGYSIISALYFIYLSISFGLQGTILIDYMSKKTQRKTRSVSYVLRILLCLLSFMYTLAKSSFLNSALNAIIQIILGITVPTLGIIFPAFMDICVTWPHNFRRGQFLYIKNMLLIIIGCFVIGCNFVCSLSFLIK